MRRARSKETPREKENRALSRMAAEEGIVLLKNENGVLPLAAGSRIALYGRGARKTVKGGTGSGSVNERSCVSIYEGLLAAGFIITTKDWLDDYDTRFDEANEAWSAVIAEKSLTMWGFDAFCTTPFRAPDGAPPTGPDADTAIYVLSRIAGENSDRRAKKGDYYLTDGEYSLLKAICGMYKSVIVVVNAGGQVDLSFLDELGNIEGLIYMGMAGMEGGTALADILLGTPGPSGKLSDTWAYKYEDYPNASGFSHNDGNEYMEYYREGIFVGYRYFDTFNVPPRYGFGFGLSYARLEIGEAAVSAGPARVTVTTKVMNTGSIYAGREVVQVYATCPCGKLDKEFRRLMGFAKTELLGPGESQELAVSFSLEALASYDEAEPGWVMEPGAYYIWTGGSLGGSRLAAVLELDRHAVLERTENQCAIVAAMKELKGDHGLAQAKREQCRRAAEERALPVYKIHAENIAGKRAVYKNHKELVERDTAKFAGSLDTDILVRLACGELRRRDNTDFLTAAPRVPGCAGETSRCAEGLGLPALVMADGPAGLRLSPCFKVKDGRVIKAKRERQFYGGAIVVREESFEEEGGQIHWQYCTAIPVGTVLAQTWNSALAGRIGEMIAGEMKEFGIALWLAPGMNIHRNPLCGRNFEYFSEDPVLTGRMAAAIISGVQGVPGCGTMAKHFACNNQEDNRHFSNSILSERALREIYLRGFEIAVKSAHPVSVMSSYNMINGVHSANNYELCTNILRCEWGFDGFVATDWRTTVHDGSCTAAGCMRAGNDLVMPGFESDLENILRALRYGTLARGDLEACVGRLASVIRRLTKNGDEGNDDFTPGEA